MLKLHCLDTDCRNTEMLEVDPLNQDTAFCSHCESMITPMEYLFRSIGYWMPEELNDGCDNLRKSDVRDILNWMGLIGVRKKEHQQPRQLQFSYHEISVLLQREYSTSDLRLPLMRWVFTPVFRNYLQEAGYQVEIDRFVKE